MPVSLPGLFVYEVWSLAACACVFCLHTFTMMRIRPIRRRSPNRPRLSSAKRWTLGARTGYSSEDGKGERAWEGKTRDGVGGGGWAFRPSALAEEKPLDRWIEKSGQRKAAKEVAASPDRLRAAVQELHGARLARSSVGPRRSILRTLKALAEGAGFRLFPASSAKIAKIGAALKAARYRAARNYLNTYKLENVRRGHVLSHRAVQLFRDTVRACQRDVAPVARSRAVRPEDLGPLRPKWLRDALVVSCWWLLRESEIRSVKTEDVSFSGDKREVSLLLPRSKTDQEGRGVERNLKCACTSEDRAVAWLCPTHACTRLVARARECGSPWLMGDASGARWRAGGWARALSEHLSPLTPYESGRSWGGHSCRRGGAQFLARRGCPVGTIKWLGRWGSDAVLKYIEELEQPDAEVAAKALRASG